MEYYNTITLELSRVGLTISEQLQMKQSNVLIIKSFQSFLFIKSINIHFYVIVVYHFPFKSERWKTLNEMLYPFLEYKSTDLKGFLLKI